MRQSRGRTAQAQDTVWEYEEDQENEVMRCARVIHAKSDLEDVCLGLESNGKPQNLSREGREWPNQ